MIILIKTKAIKTKAIIIKFNLIKHNIHNIKVNKIIWVYNKVSMVQ